VRFLFSVLILIISCEAFSNSELIYEAQKKEIKLTDKDKAILEMGEISTARYITGGILGTYPFGLGIGHAIQGRWSEDGQIFTFGELASVGVVIGGALSCLYKSGDEDWSCSSFEQTLIVLGALGFIGLRIWEIVDVWAVPPSHNSKFNKLKKYINESKQTKASLDLVPVFSPSMGQGVGFKYTF
jgi:hypothetical protein